MNNESDNEAQRIVESRKSGKSLITDVTLKSFDDFRNCVKKLTEMNKKDKIFYVLFGTNAITNTLFLGVVAPSDVEFDRTTSVDMSKTFFSCMSQEPCDNALFLLLEMQSLLRIIDAESVYFTCMDDGWACLKVDYPLKHKLFAVVMQEHVRQFADQILKEHALSDKKKIVQEPLPDDVGIW
jgi:hypothetical protein